MITICNTGRLRIVLSETLAHLHPASYGFRATNAVGRLLVWSNLD
jgi:hypothetical protein